MGEADAMSAIDETGRRVMRSGCWVNSDTSRVRSAFRLWGGPWLSYVYLGFRCARTVRGQDSHGEERR
jgi:formylglycine-generating enzyme required for sulfatase activity